jgi:hypothetical protein
MSDIFATNPLKPTQIFSAHICPHRTLDASTCGQAPLRLPPVWDLTPLIVLRFLSSPHRERHRNAIIFKRHAVETDPSGCRLNSVGWHT